MFFDDYYKNKFINAIKSPEWDIDGIYESFTDYLDYHDRFFKTFFDYIKDYKKLLNSINDNYYIDLLRLSSIYDDDIEEFYQLFDDYLDCRDDVVQFLTQIDMPLMSVNYIYINNLLEIVKAVRDGADI